MAFSSFSHIGDLQSLSFAVVLREEGNGEDIVARMLPMSRIVPGVPEEKKKKREPRVAETKEPCKRPECEAQRSRLQEMRDANDLLQDQLDEAAAAAGAAESKAESAADANRAALAANDELEARMSELDQKSAALEIEEEEGARQKRELRKKAEQLEKEIEKLRKQTEDRNRQREEAAASNQVEVVFASHAPFNRAGFNRAGSATRSVGETEERLFVESLDLWDRSYGGSAAKQSAFLSETLRPCTAPTRVLKMPTPPYVVEAMAKMAKRAGGGTKKKGN